ncbi:unnamed protein product [Brassica oleracea]|uniref:DUF1985 domain-containing protein n=1 Tax=Brassica oleracea var. oleracea TaxID=109376 RepID=A0A0D3D3I7_BRAOL
MVSQTNAARTSGRHRRRSTPTPRKQTRPRTTNRYPVSDSDEDKTASSMDSTAPTSPPVDAVDDGSSAQLPRRLFGPGFFPTGLRLNIYSKANVIGAVASTLAGLADIDVLIGSQFGRLFHLPAARCHNSTKLIGSLLYRQLITTRKYELWYTFSTHPLRFSLDEFHSITGLNCGAFDIEDSDPKASAGSIMWQKRFDTTVGDISVAQVLEMLRNPFLASWKRLRLALIALVDGVLCCTNKTLKLTPKYVEMLIDVPSFLNYPWGRLSFLHTLSRFLPPPVSKDIPDPLQELRIRLSQQTTACYGFLLALQLLAFEVVPQLLARIPDAGNTTTFLETLPLVRPL